MYSIFQSAAIVDKIGDIKRVWHDHLFYASSERVSIKKFLFKMLKCGRKFQCSLLLLCTFIQPLDSSEKSSIFFFASFYRLQLFEGMKAYRGVDGRIRIFRPNMNMNRMNMSAKRSGLPTFDGDDFIKCISRLVSIDQEWVPHTEQASLYIRPTLIGIDVSILSKIECRNIKLVDLKINCFFFWI